MLNPTVNEITALSAHRRGVALVRRSLVAAPEAPGARATVKSVDPLDSKDRGYSRTALFPTAW